MHKQGSFWHSNKPSPPYSSSQALKMSHMESSVLGAGQVGAGGMHSAGDPEARLCAVYCGGLGAGGRVETGMDRHSPVHEE